MKVLPTWLSGYNLSSLRYDLIAGFTLAAYILPAALADASLANLPPEAGLYACLFSGLVFWLFCSSKHTAISVTSGISLLVGASLSELTQGDPQRFMALASLTALLTGILALIAWLLKAGVVVNFISETVLVGFKFGIALVLVSTQLPKFFGFSGTHGDFWERIAFFLENLHKTNTTALLVGSIALLLLIAGKKFFAQRPIALLVLIAAIVLSSEMNLAAYGVKMLGDVPQGLPGIAFPLVQASDINLLLPLAIACFLLGSVETVAIGRMFAQKHKYKFDPNREFLGLGAANLAAGLGAGLPVGGGMSQSVVNEAAQAKTPLSGFFASLVILVVAVALSSSLQNLPQPVLAAVVLMAVSSLIKIEALREIWRFNRGEFLVAVAAFIGVLGSGILRGVLIGAILSLVLLLRIAARPRTVELGRVPGKDLFFDRERHPENERVPGVFVFRVEGAILYFNSEYVSEQFFELLRQYPGKVQLVVFFLGMVPRVDLAGARALLEIQETVRAQGIEFRLAEIRGNIRDQLRRAGFEKEHGPVTANETVQSVIEKWKNTQV
jgi:SulP family sulfate permease